MRNALLTLPIFLLAACHANDDGPVACEKDTAELLANTCVDSTGTYDIGDVWICPDSCNFCGCLEDSVIFSTGMVCDTIPPDTDTGTSDTGDTVPADTDMDTSVDTGSSDTAAPVDTGTGASDTGTGTSDTDTGAADTDTADTSG